MNTTFKKLALSIAISSVMAALPMSASATNGNQATAAGQSARGVVGAGIAYPQDTLAASINPAAGVHVGNRIDAGLEIFMPDRDLTLGGQTFDANETDTFFIPEFGWNKMIGENQAFTIVVSGAGGQNTDYALHPLFGGPVEVNLAQLFIQPTYSAKFGKHSIGASLNLVYQTFEANGLGRLAANSSDPSNFTDNGESDATGAGVSLGWMGELSDKFTLGAMYQSEIGMGNFDEYAGLFPGGSVDIPEKYGVGMALAASDKVDLLLDFTQVNYSKTAALGNPTTGDGRSPLGFENGPGFGWSDTLVVRFGVVFKKSEKTTLRAGYSKSDQPVPNDSFNDAFFNSLAPAVTTDHFSLGFTQMIKPGLAITGSYVRTFDETVDGNGAIPAGAPGAGTPAADLRMDQNAFGVTFSWFL
jgi:long-chain fatty acid transport protein